MQRSRATWIGFSAIGLWSLLALFTVASAPVPPFLLSALCFTIGGTIGIIWAMATGQIRILLRIPATIYAFGTLGLFGYHALYFSALRLAPPAQAGLIAYLWPLLIVLFSGLLPGEKLRSGHIFGALICFFGAGIIIGGDLLHPTPGALPGYILAALCALTWSGYSVLSRRLGAVPTISVTVFCLATAALSGAAHMLFEETLWPTGITGWLAVIALGLGPVGLAFFTWDIGMKSGDIQMLGTAAYAAPLLSTLILIFAGMAEPRPAVLIAALLIATGAAIAARAGRRR
ncbi:MAG: EamA family transporter [Rhodobacterales bacterium]|nr:MAG: EamA family transporter [Rhodobacterales bacterium]